MKKIKRKQIDFGGTEKQYVRGDGELDVFDDIFTITLSSDISDITEITSLNVSCDKTAEEILTAAIDDKKTLAWKVLCKNNNDDVRFSLIAWKTNLQRRSDGDTRGIFQLYYLLRETYIVFTVNATWRPAHNQQGIGYNISHADRFFPVPDWNQTNPDALDFIKNKPEIPTPVDPDAIFDGFYFPNAVKDLDDNWYGAVIVGDKVWLAENYRCTKLPDGTPIANGSSIVNNGTELNSTTIPYYYLTNNESSLTESKGLKYNFSAVSNGETSTETAGEMKGIAPTNWHIPAPSEYQDLLDYIASKDKYNVEVSNGFYTTPVLANKDSIESRFLNEMSDEEQAIVNATGFGFKNSLLFTSHLISATPGASATERVTVLMQGDNATTNKRYTTLIGTELSSGLPTGYGAYLRFVSDLNPIQFRNWYVETYGSLQHHLPEGGNANLEDIGSLTIKQNNVVLDTFDPASGIDTTININVPTQASDIGALASSTPYAASLSLSIDNSTFVITGQLLDQNGSPLGTPQLIDLPLESVVVNGTYNSQTGNIILTLQNGNTIEFPVTALVSGLQNVQADWNQTDPTQDDYIKHKPTIPEDLGVYFITITRTGSDTEQDPYVFTCDKSAADITENICLDGKKAVFVLAIPVQHASFILNQANAEWTISNNILYSYETFLFYEYGNDKVNILFQLKHYVNNVNDDITITQTTGLSQLQADWNQDNTHALDYIKNKPLIADDIYNAIIVCNKDLYAAARDVSPGFTFEFTAQDLFNAYKAQKKVKYYLKTLVSDSNSEDLYVYRELETVFSSLSGIEISDTYLYSYIKLRVYDEAAQINNQTASYYNITLSANYDPDSDLNEIVTGFYYSLPQADWNQTNVSALDYIKNKPVIDEYIVELYSSLSSPSETFSSEILTCNKTADEIVAAVKTGKKLSYYVRFTELGRTYWLHLSESDLGTNVSAPGTNHESYLYSVVLYSIIGNQRYEVYLEAYSNKPGATYPSSLTATGGLVNNFSQADWNQTNPNSSSYIWNKPSLPLVVDFTSGYNYLTVVNENCTCNKTAVEILEALIAKRDIDYKLNFSNGDRVSLTDAGEDFTTTIQASTTQYVITKRLFNQNLHSKDYVELLLHLFVEKNTATNVYTVNSFYAIANHVSAASPIPNNGNLNIQVNEEALTSFGADQSTNVNLDFKQGTGITLEKDTTNNRIVISSKSNHRITSKDIAIQTKGDSSTAIVAYSYNVLCELNSVNMTLVDISDFCPASAVYNHTNVYHWTKTANETGRYIGLCHARSTKGNIVGKLTINDSINNEIISYYIAAVVDTPPTATFAFATNCSWPIDARFDTTANTSEVYLLAYMRIPDGFVGDIYFTPLRKVIKSPSNANYVQFSCFDYQQGTTTLNHYYWKDVVAGGTQQLNTLDTLLFNPIPAGTAGIIQPFGKYQAHIMGDFGGTLVVGSKVSDFVVNDFYLHSLEERVRSITSLYNLLPNLPTPTVADAGKVLTVDSSGNYVLQLKQSSSIISNQP